MSEMVGAELGVDDKGFETPIDPAALLTFGSERNKRTLWNIYLHVAFVVQYCAILHPTTIATTDVEPREVYVGTSFTRYISAPEWPSVLRYLCEQRYEHGLRFRLSYMPDDRILVFVSGNAHEVGTSMLIPLITAAMSSQLNTPVWETFTFGGSQTLPELLSLKCNFQPRNSTTWWKFELKEANLAQNEPIRHWETDTRASSTKQIKEPAQTIYPDSSTQRPAPTSILVELYEEDPDPTGGARRRGDGLILSGDLAGKSLLILWTDLFDAGTVPGYLTAPGQPPGITIDEGMLNAWKSAIFRAVSNSACLPNLGGAYLHSYR
ncbi:hypothetical protein C8R46DRAFT_1251661 [Mycena filopes]|nr:hypothetical protein C8R46DRAFT_1251661 [Mycena filopes]